MLCAAGIKDVDKALVNICTGCIADLQRKKMPVFALGNELYRGNLPERFQQYDPPITAAEEMVCAIYHNTMNVTRLYGSEGSDKESTVMYGNTCAFEMNYISTAEQLPRMPVDVNKMITVVYVGATRPTEERLRKCTQFRVRRAVILDLLSVLCQTNPLYKQYVPNADILAMYPEDGILPGLVNSIVFEEYH
ncbi:hypothetical protein K435DRAFT_671573, partial [Dendrothele bispora CBS 962.96]